MERMKFESDNLVENNVEKIGKLFPNCITESKDENGKLKKAINFDMLKQMLSEDVVEGDEKYEFTWVGKKESIVEAHKPIRKTLRPCKEESVNWDKTENLYIEGDNLDVLKLLQESYLGKVDVIYIDPPYNTGNNLIYKNNFFESEAEFNVRSGIIDDEENRLVTNSKSNGRFHSAWCSEIYPVLLISQSLLSKSGYIAIAMDDNELFTLKMMCDEIFGQQNFVGTLVTKSNPQGRSKKNLDPIHEYHLLYARDISALPYLKIKKVEGSTSNRYLLRSGTNSRKYERPLRFYPMLLKNGKVSTITKEEYANIYSNKHRFDEEYISKLRQKYEKLGYQYILPISKNGEEKIWQRTFDRVSQECSNYIFEGGQIKVCAEETRTPVSLWTEKIYSNVQNGTNRLKELFDNKPIFDFSKSIFTVKDIISLNATKNNLILDFFSGSATTAHAVMQLNAEDGGNRNFVMVQRREHCDEKSEAFKAGYKNICEIGKERIRRAGKKIINENPDKTENLDIGFRTFKLDTTNMKDVYYSAGEYTQNLLSSLESNIKEDRTDLDLFFGCLLEWGLPLSMPYKYENIEGFTIHTYNDGDLIACFDENISDEVIKVIANRKPLHAVFRDSSFKDSPSKINVGEIFKMISPDTKLHVM